MTCQQTRDILPDHTVGLLDEPTTAALEAHISTCADCAAEARRYTRLMLLLDHMPRPVATKDIWPGVRAGMEIEKSVAGLQAALRETPVHSWWSSALAAAAGFACAVVIMVSLALQGGGSAPTAQTVAAVPPLAVSVSQHNAMEPTSPVADGASIVAVDAITVHPVDASSSMPGGAVR